MELVILRAPMRVLLVDGHRGVREGLSDRLRRDPRVGAVVTASSLGAALLTAQGFAPDVVLCDPTTIGGDGIGAAAAAVRRLGRLGRPLVVLAPSLAEGERAGLWRAGAAVVLLKGCAFPELLAALEQVAAERTPAPAAPAG